MSPQQTTPKGKRPEAYLYLEDGDRIFRVSLNHSRMLIGSGKDNDVVIRDPLVAPRHAALTWNGRIFEVTTIAQTHDPVVVNGQPVAVTRRLVSGDVVQVARTKMRFVRVPRIADSVLQLCVMGSCEYPWFALWDRPLVRVGHTRGDMLINDEFLADPHFSFENLCVGALYIVNHDEHRGTTVNGQPVLGRRRVFDGDVVKAGVTKIVVRIQADRVLPHPKDAVPLPSGLRSAKDQPPEVDTDEVPIFQDPKPAPGKKPKPIIIAGGKPMELEGPIGTEDPTRFNIPVVPAKDPRVSVDATAPAPNASAPVRTEATTEKDIHVVSGMSEVGKRSNTAGTMVLPREEAISAYEQEKKSAARASSDDRAPYRPATTSSDDRAPLRGAGLRRKRPSGTQKVADPEATTREDLPVVPSKKKPKR